MFKEELGKIMSNIVFFLAILGVVVLLMLSNVYTSPETGEEYSVIGLATDKDKDALIKNGDLHAPDIIVGGVTGYMDMFVPVLVSVPFVMIVCGEKKNSNTRFEIYRVGKNRYITGRYFASMVAGGIVLMTGYIIFSVIISFIFPGNTGMLMEYQNEFILQQGGLTATVLKHFGMNGLYIIKFIRMFLYGAFFTTPAFGLSAVIRNRYIVISIPFMLSYLFQKVAEKHVEMKLYRVIPENIGRVYNIRWKEMLIVFGCIIILVPVLCRIYLGRKCDCGEE